MMWLILTPFLILCLAALGLTLAEAADYFRAGHSDSTHSLWTGTFGSPPSVGKRHAFHPGDPGDSMGALPWRSSASVQ